MRDDIPITQFLRLSGEHGEWDDDRFTQAAERIEALEAENDQLREALRDLANRAASYVVKDRSGK